MNKAFPWVVCIGASVILGVVLILAALGDKLARWGGYAEALPFMGLFVLFLIGQGVVSAIVPKRRVLR